MKNKIIKIKQNLNWHWADAILYGFHSTGLMCDSEFKKLFKQLEDYISSKLSVPSGVTIKDTYAVCECEIIDEKAYNESISKK